jgi:hypothetical protein
MKRVRLNAIVDVVAFPLLLLSLFCGVVAWKVLPSGGELGGGRGAGHQIFLGLARTEWRDIHIYASLVLAALMLFHLVLHWSWIRCMPHVFARSRGANTCPPDCSGHEQENGGERS